MGDAFQLELVAVGMTVPPIPVLSLLAAFRLVEGHMISGMLHSECLVGALFAVVPVMVIFVIVVVDPDTNRLWCGISPNRHRNDKSGGQEK